MDGSFEEVMLVDFEMDNFITLQVSHSVLWRVEYPSTGETAESVTLVYVRQRDVLGIVPLAEVRKLSSLSHCPCAPPRALITAQKQGYKVYRETGGKSIGTVSKSYCI